MREGGPRPGEGPQEINPVDRAVGRFNRLLGVRRINFAEVKRTLIEIHRVGTETMNLASAQGFLDQMSTLARQARDAAVERRSKSTGYFNELASGYEAAARNLGETFATPNVSLLRMTAPKT